MFKRPAINLRRVFLVAQRDFWGYVKTWGFWITVLSPIFGIGFAFLLSLLSLNAEPVRYAAILDETGRYEPLILDHMATARADIEAELLRQSARILLPADQRAELDSILDEQGVEAGREFLAKDNAAILDKIKMPEQGVKIVALPAPDFEALLPYIEGRALLEVEGAPATLSGLLHITDEPAGVEAKYWTIYPSAKGLDADVNLILRREAEHAYFEDSDLQRAEFYAASSSAPRLRKLDPTKTANEDGGGQDVTFADNIPLLVAAALSAFLWLSIFSGAYMLLMSMVEEKINKALEMLLASTRFAEILFGKLLGVAALTVASMAPWLIMGGVGLFAFITFGEGAIASAVSQAVTPKIISLFLIFFVLGYVFYGALFMALGSLAESLQDAQTLVTPVLILLTMCVMVVPIGMTAPDSPILRAASYIPFSAPFAVLVRLPSEPPLWEVILSALILLLSTLFVIWLSARLFRYGVLSGSGVTGVKSFISRKLFRRG